MAFSVAYYDLLDKNIRHIYSSLPSNCRFRCDPEPGMTLHPHDGCVNSLTRKGPAPQTRVPQKLHRRLWEFSPDYGAEMPKAPAFRCASTAEVQNIVDRVSRMTRTHKRRRVSYLRQCLNDRFTDCPPTDDYSCPRHLAMTPTLGLSRTPTPGSSVARGPWGWSCGPPRGADSPKPSSGEQPQPPLERARTPGEQEASTQRLLRPTTVTLIRSDLKVGSAMNPVEVVAERSRSSRSGRRTRRSTPSSPEAEEAGPD